MSTGTKFGSYKSLTSTMTETTQRLVGSLAPPLRWSLAYSRARRDMFWRCSGVVSPLSGHKLFLHARLCLPDVLLSPARRPGFPYQDAPFLLIWNDLSTRNSRLS